MQVKRLTLEGVYPWQQDKKETNGGEPSHGPTIFTKQNH